MDIPILIMAAGSSSRLGQAKQLLPFDGQTLISYTVNECLRSKLGPVYVVVGSRAKEIKREIHHLDCKVVENKQWEKGLGSSISCGVRFVQGDQIDGVLIVLVDQVYFSSSILLDVWEKRLATKAPIVMCAYDEGKGPPTFFESSLFQELIQLENESGAKKVINNHRADIQTISFSRGHLDIDTQEDLSRLRKI